MTCKHYEAVARILRDELTLADTYDAPIMVGTAIAVVHRTAHSLAGVFAADNPRFDRGRFLAACGIGE